MSKKSDLYIICAKQFKELPQLETKRRGGTDHLPKWKTTITLPNKIVIISSGSGSKIKVENKASSKAVRLIKQTSVKYKIPHRTHLFIDIENRGDIKNVIHNIYPKNRIHGFVSDRYNDSINEQNKKYFDKYCNLHIVNSIRKDAADIGMIVEGTRQIQSSNIKELWILTQDSFALTWKEINEPLFPNVEIKTFESVKSLIQEI